MAIKDEKWIATMSGSKDKGRANKEHNYVNVTKSSE
jgi:hypothetical protein